MTQYNLGYQPMKRVHRRKAPPPYRGVVSLPHPCSSSNPAQKISPITQAVLDAHNAECAFMQQLQRLRFMELSPIARQHLAVHATKVDSKKPAVKGKKGRCREK